MANTPVTTEIHQALNVHRHFPTQITFHYVVRNLRAQLLQVFLGQLDDVDVWVNTGGFADLMSACATDPVDSGQRYPSKKNA